MSRPCDDMLERIVDFTLGILSEEHTRDVQAHVDECEACRRYMQALAEQSEALVAMSRDVQTDMDARQKRVIEALQAGASARPRVLPFIGGFIRVGVAAVLMLGVGIVVGRLSAPRPVDVDQLRSELRASIVASLQPVLRENVRADMARLDADVRSSVIASLEPVVREHVRAERDQLAAELRSSIAALLEPALREILLEDVDERLESALLASDERIAAHVVEQIRQDLHVVASELAAGSERLVDQRFGEVVQLIEAARQTDRRQIARALDQIKTQTGMGLLKLAARTEERPVIRKEQ